MTLAASDVLLMLTTTAGAAGSSAAQPTPTASLGKYASTTQVVSGSVGVVFDTVTAAQATAGYTDYRAVAIRNASATEAATSALLWITDQVGGGVYTIGLDPVGIVAYNSAAAQGTSIATKTTAPTGVTFTAPSSVSPLTVGTMAANTVQLVWIKRVISALTPGTAADLVTLYARAETV
jgi:hypothetical protein